MGAFTNYGIILGGRGFEKYEGAVGLKMTSLFCMTSGENFNKKLFYTGGRWNNAFPFVCCENILRDNLKLIYTTYTNI